MTLDLEYNGNSVMVVMVKTNNVENIELLFRVVKCILNEAFLKCFAIFF